MSTTYRYYYLDTAGRLHSAQSFEASSDEAALALVESKHPGARCEVWQGSRLIGAISPERQQA